MRPSETKQALADYKKVRSCRKIDLEIQVPADFPLKYRDSLVRSAELCAVKKHLEKPPRFEVTTATVETA
jgi:ribosomal protein S12 methylthiotransferase accessory factor